MINEYMNRLSYVISSVPVINLSIAQSLYEIFMLLSLNENQSFYSNYLQCKSNKLPPVGLIAVKAPALFKIRFLDKELVCWSQSFLSL